MDAPVLLETIDKVGRAASRDESRPVLTGILVRFEGDRLIMAAATDSYRLAVKETALTASAPELDAIIPARALQELTIWLLMLQLLVLAIGGGLALSKFVFLLLVVALVLAIFGVFGRSTT